MFEFASSIVSVNGVMSNYSDLLRTDRGRGDVEAAVVVRQGLSVCGLGAERQRDDLPSVEDRVRTHLWEDDDFITPGKTDENIPASHPPLRAECEPLRTERQLLNHANRETAFFLG